MEDADRLIPSLVARAALVCGAAVACLFLLSGTARADEGPEASHDPARVGGLLGGTLGGSLGDALDETVDGAVDGATGAVGDTVDDVTERASDTVTTVEQAVSDVTQGVRNVAEDPGGGVGQVVDDTTGAVDRVVGGLLGPGGGGSPAEPEPVPPAEPVDEPTADPPAGADKPAAPAGAAPTDQPADGAARGVRRHADSGRDHPARERHAASAHPGDRAGSVTSLPAPVEVAPRPSTSPASSDPATARVDGASGTGSPLLLGPACDDCAAAGGSSGDTPHLLGLPSAGVSTPRTAAEVPRASAVGGPISVADRPDVSPG